MHNVKKTPVLLPPGCTFLNFVQETHRKEAGDWPTPPRHDEAEKQALNCGTVVQHKHTFVRIHCFDTRFFYKQHFYKQHEAQNGQKFSKF